MKYVINCSPEVLKKFQDFMATQEGEFCWEPGDMDEWYNTIAKSTPLSDLCEAEAKKYDALPSRIEDDIYGGFYPINEDAAISASTLRSFGSN